LAGRIDIDLDKEPLGVTANGQAICLADIWPSPETIAALTEEAGEPGLFSDVYGVRPPGILWDELEAPAGKLFPWDPRSTYLLEPPFLALAQSLGVNGLPDRISDARILGVYGDSLTTDHISPSSEIPLESEAGRYLIGLGVNQESFNTYVGRRCNHEVMARGTFANIRIKNQMVASREGGWTRLLPEDCVVSIYEAAIAYQARQVPVIILGGKDYGMGSSRDWAAKGSALLGVRAVIAESYERIHRSNLIGMGVAPLLFASGEGWRRLGLDGTEEITIDGLSDAIRLNKPATVTAHGPRGDVTFTVTADLSTRSERECLSRGGIAAEIFASFTRAAEGARPVATAGAA
jgi:aconitate hydratase